MPTAGKPPVLRTIASLRATIVRIHFGILLLLIVLNSCASAHTDVTAQRARDLINSTNDLVIVDVREPHEYCSTRGHIPGARNYPWTSGVLRARFGELPANAPVLVVCAAGGRSNSAASFLDSSGFSEVYDMLRGMSAWLWETAPCKYSGGSGTPDDPYQIATAADLIALGETPEDYDKHFILAADIDLDPNLPGRKVFDRAVIAPDVNDAENFFQGSRFTGVVDGGGHVISHLSIDGAGYLGLFGLLEYGATVSNLGLASVDINGAGSGVGSLAGASHGSISTSYSTGTVNGKTYVGGLVGFNSDDGLITTSYSTVAVSGAGDSVGGLVGCNWGGLDGYGRITMSYSTGAVDGIGDYVGGLVGVDWGSVDLSFWDMQSSGQTTSGGGTGKTTSEMRMATTFLNWWCSSAWTLDEGSDYPHLWWESAPGELITNPYWSGTGAPDDPYLICTAAQLNMIGLIPCDWDKHFKLMADIDLSSYKDNAFNIIGGNVPSDQRDKYYAPPAFSGQFDGNGHTISNFVYDCNGADVDFVGLFGFASNAVIRDLGLINPNVRAGTGNHVGALIGYLWGGTISGCYVRRVSVCGGEGVGGLVGLNSGSITASFSTGAVKASSQVGGLVGNNLEGARIVASYSMAEVSANNHVGGLVGENFGTIDASYSAGIVSAGALVGGLVGIDFPFFNIMDQHPKGRTIASFWDMETSGQDTSAGGVGKSTAEMQTASTFLEAGWDFVGETTNGPNDIWKISEGLDYPRIWWEKYGGGTGEPNNPYLIYSAEHLNELGAEPNDWDKHFRLMADIDLAGYVYDAALIAPDGDPVDPAFQGTSFAGVFDGNGYAILNLTIDGAGYLGLFGLLDRGAEVADLELLDVSISGADYVGGLVGFNYGSITASRVTGEVTGNNRVGGMTGRNWGSIAASCTAGTVTGVHDVGGLVAGNYGKITTSYSTAAVSGNKDVGGLVAENYGSIADSYSTGTVAANTNPGGLVAYNWPDGGTVSGFWDVETSGLTTSDGGTGMTTAEMQAATTFLDAGWDFADETANGTDDIWWILDGQGYPRLWWQAEGN